MKKNNCLLLSIMFCITLLFIGCATSGNESLRTETEKSVNAKLTEGVTTKDEVKAMFGSPFETSYTDGGLEIWKYELSKMKADANNFIPFVNILVSSASGMKKELTIMQLKGSVELAPIAGLADCIVDIVETGRTLEANDLMVLKDLCSVSARLICNKVSYRFHLEKVVSIVEALRGLS